jgi:hypothetical protein
MIRLTVLAFALALSFGASAQAMPLVPPHQSDTMVVAVRAGCGAGFQRVGGRCVRNTAVRTVRRCATGLRLVNGRCIR